MLKYLKDYVELRTKVASVFPFFYVLTIYLYGFSDYQFSFITTMMFFISMLCLDMATTVLNHLAGMKKESDISVYDQRLLMLMEEHQITDRFNKVVLYSLLLIGIGLGLIIGLTTNIFVIVIGVICVVVALTYSYGPLPTKNTPLGEVLSGGTMGVLIPLAFLFAQDSSLFITSISLNQVTIDLQMVIVWAIILIVPTMLIANIMLANNTCDIQKDINNNRITLPIVIGLRPSKGLFISLYLCSYLAIISLIIIQVLPLLAVVGLLTVPFVFRNSFKFTRNPQKAMTFKYAVFNLQLVLLSVIIPLMIVLIIN